MRVFISTGEASGDAYGAALASRLREFAPSVEIAGSGGKRMREAGVRLIADSSHWGAISIVQSLKVVPRLAGSYYRIKRELASGQPGLFIPIDFGYANLRFAYHAKKNGWNVLYFVPPGSWRRDRQGKDLPGLTDAISTPFSWSADLLQGMGANVRWFGHPIKELLGASVSDAARVGIAVLPGSRAHEINENLPIIAKAFAAYDGDLTFALASTTDAAEFMSRWGRLSGRSRDKYSVGQAAETLRSSRGALVCSGTATLEAALLKTPMVVMYRLSKAVLLETKIVGFKKPEFVALPNILMQRQIVPELIQENAIPEAIRDAMAEIMKDSHQRSQQLADFEELDQLLGPADAITKTAQWATEWLK